jgi:signal transduction histidine kinase/CheY-like chemotaxis protein
LDIQNDEFDAFDDTDVSVLETLSTQIASAIENARLFEDSNRRAERLAVINRIGNVAATAHNLEKLMAGIYEEINLVFKPDAFFIAFLDHKINELEFGFLIEEGQRQPLVRFPLGNGFSSKVVLDKKPLIVRDYERDRHALPQGLIFGNQKPALSWIGVPLKYTDQIIGIVSIQSYRPNVWDEEDIQLFFTIVDQIAGTIEKARLFEEARIRTERLTVINRIGKIAATANNLDKLMEAIYEEIHVIFRPDTFFIAFLDDKNNELEARFLMEEGKKLPIARYPIGSSLSSKVIVENKPLIIKDFDQEQNALPSGVLFGNQIPAQSWIGVPLKLEDQVIGLVNIQSKKSNAWNDEDIQLFFTITDQIAGTIAKARLYEEARIRAERLTVINRIGKLATTADNLEKLMEAIYEEIDRSFHPDCFFIGIIDDERKNLEFRFLIENGVRLSNEYQPIGGGWSSKVIEDQKPLIIFDLNKELDHLPMPLQVGSDAAGITWIGVPLSFEDQVIGLVNIQSTKRNAWSEEDIQLFFTIADQIAGIIAKARLYEALEQELNERKKAEEKKKELETQLRQAQKMEAIGTLAGGIAHDFNNVLYPIIGFAEMTMDLVPEKSVAQKNLVEIITAADRAKDLIQQILTFSRQQEHKPQPMKIQSIIKEALKLMRSSMPATISLVQNIDEQCGPIMADPSQVHQIIMNLCTNAYYAMRKQGGILEVALSEIDIQPGSSNKAFPLNQGLYLCLTVRDTGDGIDPLILDRIFDPYFTTKPPGEGTGMGLALVHGIVKSYGGEISVSSQPGKGTVFHICVPRIMEPEKQIDILKQKCIPGQGETILFVDDEKQIIDMVKQMLESLNYKVVVQMDSIEALHEFQRKPEQFDLVITDQTMPRMTGFELSRKMLAMRKDLPIILCTGFSDLVNEEQAHAIGIRKFILKPIMKSQLSGLVHEILNKT